MRYDTVSYLFCPLYSLLNRSRKQMTEISASKVAPGAPKAIDERVRRSRETVLAATSELLFERGFAGVSVDEVSRRSGVAKTTIYRHWPTRADLLRDACAAISTPQAVPDTGSLEPDLNALMTGLAELLSTAKWVSVMPSVIDAAERDPDIADVFTKLQRGYTLPIETVILRAVTKRELPEDTDVATLVAALTGPLFYRRWFSRDPLTEQFAKEIVRLVIR
jgi:AcrR family transcriptional regulator